MGKTNTTNRIHSRGRWRTRWCWVESRQSWGRNGGRLFWRGGGRDFAHWCSARKTKKAIIIGLFYPIDFLGNVSTKRSHAWWVIPGMFLLNARKYAWAETWRKCIHFVWLHSNRLLECHQKVVLDCSSKSLLKVLFLKFFHDKTKYLKFPTIFKLTKKMSLMVFLPLALNLLKSIATQFTWLILAQR